MTKEIIFQYHRSGLNRMNDITAAVYPAMNDYAKQEAIAFLKWKSSKGYYAQGVTLRTTNDDPCWIRQENQLVFSNPISTNALYELYLKSK